MESVDGIVRFARDYSDDGERALLSTGEDGLRLMMDSFLGETDETPEVPWRPGVEGIDRFNHGLHLLAVQHPEAFIARVEHHPLPFAHQRMMVAISLGEIGRPGTAHLLCRFLDDDDWLVRLHAVQNIGRLAGERPEPCVGRVLRDNADMVQLHAIRVVSRWDTASAIAHYERFLKQGRIVRSRRPAAHLRREAEADLADLRRGVAR